MSDPPPTTEREPRAWRLAAALMAVLALLLLISALGLIAEERPAPRLDLDPSATDQTIRLTHRSAAGREASIDVPWRPGLTVADATQVAGRLEPRVWQSAWEGEGKMAFLTQLGGVRNEGGDGRNWLFSVNGERSDRGAGAVAVGPDDRVLWELAEYR